MDRARARVRRPRLHRRAPAAARAQRGQGLDRRVPLARRSRRGGGRGGGAGDRPARRRRRASRCTGGARCSRCARRSCSTRGSGIASAAARRCRSTPRCTSATTPPTSTPSAALRALAQSGRARERRVRGRALRRSAARAGARGRPDGRRHGRRAGAARGAAVGALHRALRRLPQDDRPAQRRRGHRAGGRHRARGRRGTPTARIAADRGRLVGDRGAHRPAPGRRAETNPPIARLLAGAKASTTLPEHHPSAILVNRLWPLLLFTLLAGGLAFLAPQIPGIAAGFAIIWALAWRRQDAAVAAIEERDGACLLRAPHLAGAADGAGAHAGLQGAAPRARERRRHLRCVGGRPVDVLIVSLGSTGGLRAADAELRDSLRRAGASVAARAAAASRRELRTLMLTDLPLGARRARCGSRPSCAAPDARGRSSTRARPPRCCGRGPGRSASTRPRRATGPGVTGSGSARSSAGACARRRCCCRGARAACARRPTSARAPRSRAGAARRRSSPSGRRRRRRGAGATSPRSPTPPTRPRRASTACSRPGGACARCAMREELRGRRRRRPSELRRCRARAARARRACAWPARSRPRSTARCCAARACSCARRAARTTGSPSSRRSPTAVSSSPRPRPGPTPRCRSRARSTRAWWARISERALRAALDDPRGRLRRARARGARAVHAATAVDRLVAERATAAPACVASAAARHGPRVGDVLAASATRAARWPRPSACSPACSCGGRRSRSRSARPRRAAARAWTSERSRRSGLALISSIVPVRAAAANTASQVDRVGLASLDQPAGRVADRVHERVLDRGDHALGHRLFAHPERRCARSRSPSRARASSSSS